MRVLTHIVVRDRMLNPVSPSARTTPTPTFWDDLVAAAVTLASSPRFLITCLMVEVGIFDLLNAILRNTHSGWPVVAEFGYFFVFVGFCGTERLWFKRIWGEEAFRPRSAMTATRGYMRRYVGLAFVLGTPVLLAGLVGMGMDANAGHRKMFGPNMVVWFTVTLLLTDVAATFITPALAFTTRSTDRATRLGLRLLWRTWPHGAGYILMPPLALVTLSRSLAGGLLPAVAYTLPLATTLVALVAKGATARFYLRLDIEPEPGAEPV